MAVTVNGVLKTTADGYPAVKKLNKKINDILVVTQAEYDALATKDPNTLYIVTT